jgi:hypothetical protein
MGWPSSYDDAALTELIFSCRLQHNMAAQQLPTAVLASVLQFVPLKQRLLECALVYKAWSAAAAAATSTISLKRECVPKSLEAWLRKHGGAVDSLVLELFVDYEGYFDSLPSNKEEEEEESSSASGDAEPGWDLDGSNSNSTLSHQHAVACSDDGSMVITGDADADSSSSASTSSSTPSAEVDDAELYQLQLPCAELQQLTRLSVGASGCMCLLDPDLTMQPLQHQLHHSKSYAVLPKLVDLKLVGCKLASLDSMHHLFRTVGPQLTQLHVQQLYCPPPAWAGPQAEEQGPFSWDNFLAEEVLPTALQSCSILITLHFLQSPDLRGAGVWSESCLSVSALSSLLKLQELFLLWPHPARAPYLPAFPPSLTQLSLTSESSWGSENEEPLVLPQLADLQHLRVLKLQYLQLSVATLRSMTQVLSLQLEHVAVDGTTLGSMTQLQQLVLHHCHDATPHEQPGRCRA